MLILKPLKSNKLEKISNIQIKTTEWKEKSFVSIDSLTMNTEESEDKYLLGGVSS